VDEILKQADSNFSQTIDYSEFLLACSKREELLSVERIKNAFHLFDIDNNGYISKNEFMEVMGGLDADDSKWDQLLQDFDTDNDKKVNKTFFSNLLNRFPTTSLWCF
jgi:Ca2+-binding EF-hand superfamily protein